VGDYLHRVVKWAGRVGLVFALLLVLYVALRLLAPASIWTANVQLGLIVTGTWLVLRLLRPLARRAVWRLRNRLLVAYVFIAVVPFLLVAALAGLSGYWLVRQLAVYLVTSELDRRVDSLQTFTESVVRTSPESRPFIMERNIDLFYRSRFPGIQVLLRETGNRQIRYPEGATPPAPLPGWEPTSGVLVRDGHYFLWSYARTGTGDVTVTAPLSKDFLANLVPNLGLVDIGRATGGALPVNIAQARNLVSTRSMPPPRSRFDSEVVWFATLPAADWMHPDHTEDRLFISVRSRLSAVLAAVFNRHADYAQGAVQFFLILNAIVFVVVEIVSVVIGIGMTRSITGAVHRLYEGTQKVIEGDLSHRILVTGNDQLAELSRSFNRMTENVERLLIVAKEKERIEADIEIAREVQRQLFPHELPLLRTLRVKAVCRPARLVSGDYFDYEMLCETQVALAIADVAGKGISAALLMAALQSSLKSQLQNSAELSLSAGNGHKAAELSTSHLVSNLNKQLHATTSPEKYATFCLGVYDEPSSTFSYTNAGHLPPLLVRQGEVTRLEVNGTVVGAFPFSLYDESHLTLESGDLLVWYTDGVTEPENEYGQMFGEERLIELLARNADREEDEIIRVVLDSVRQWTASDELQDDMTVMVARRV
jgi:phosphoserine phosphatase RsbU/P